MDDVFLVYRDGVLISDVHREGKGLTVDADLISGMFSAVQDFIRDSFIPETVSEDEGDKSKWEMKKIEFGDRNIIIEHRPRLYLATIFTGREGWHLKKQIRETMDEITQTYQKVIPHWEGMVSEFEGVEAYLQKILSVETQPSFTSSSPISEDSDEITGPEVMEDFEASEQNDEGTMGKDDSVEEETYTASEEIEDWGGIVEDELAEHPDENEPEVEDWDEMVDPGHEMKDE